MIIGALLDAGLSFESLEAGLAKLNLTGYKLSSQKAMRGGIAGTKFDVEIELPQPHRNPEEIFAIIEKSTLDDDVKSKAIAIFKRLAEAEAKVHNLPIDKVHFHEIGAVDAIIDICGAVIGLKLMGIGKIYSSELTLGRGMVKTEHGLLPVPAPATAELVKGFPVRMGEIEFELTTPTGAAILTALADFKSPENYVVKAIGYSAGNKEFEGVPNLLRVIVGESEDCLDSDTIIVMETNLDRVTSENLGSLIDDLMAAGALEAFVSAVHMKKNRPGHFLTVLCEPDKKDGLAKKIFRSGKTLGIRIDYRNRLILPRHEIMVSIAGEIVRLKIAEIDGEKLIFPEHDDVLKLMKKMNRDYDEIYFQIQSVFRKGVTNG